jgi:acyl-CoA thioester hydrolase
LSVEAQSRRAKSANVRSAPAARRGQTFRLPLTVYYEDTDAAGVVYYANYLKFMERARTEWLGSLGFAVADFEAAHGVVFVVHRMEIEYRAPARLGDRVEATLELAELGRARMVALQQVRRGTTLLAQARVTLACVEREHWRPARIPAVLHGRLEKTI